VAGRLRYLLGGRLPGHIEWVRHDLTDAGWPLRVLGRAFIPLVPVIIVAGALPLPGIALHVATALLVVLAWGLTIPAFVQPLRDRRLRQHDLTPPTDDDPPDDPPPQEG
jgi:hypothetical protein